MTIRSIPPWLSEVLEQLELRQPKVVTKQMVEEILLAMGSSADPRTVLDELQRRRWLLPLKTQGAWEFAPAARAGGFGAGDPFIELRATIERRPELKLAVAEESAAWLHGLLNRQPTRDAISAPRGVVLPEAISDYRVVRVAFHLPPAEANGLPAWSVETLLVLMADRPSAFKLWSTANEWLPDAFRRADLGRMIEELEGHDAPTLARLGHMASESGAEDVAAQLRQRTPHSPGGPFYLGPHNRHGTWDPKWRVLDSLLDVRGPR